MDFFDLVLVVLQGLVASRSGKVSRGLGCPADWGNTLYIIVINIRK
jgi:hypothetical protein